MAFFPYRVTCHRYSRLVDNPPTSRTPSDAGFTFTKFRNICSTQSISRFLEITVNGMSRNPFVDLVLSEQAKL